MSIMESVMLQTHQVCVRGQGKQSLSVGGGKRGGGGEKGSCYPLYIMQMGLTQLVCWTNIEFLHGCKPILIKPAP